MQIKVSGRHAELEDSVRSYASEKAEKLSRFYDRLLSVDVVFDHQAGRYSVEMIARADHHMNFVAKHEDPDPYKSVDFVAKEVEGQLRRHKEKFRNRKHLGGREDKHSMGERSATEIGSEGEAP
jgi:putative sigma-54 modulation protein